eukprot:1030259_1
MSSFYKGRHRHKHLYAQQPAPAQSKKQPPPALSRIQDDRSTFKRLKKRKPRSITEEKEFNIVKQRLANIGKKKPIYTRNHRAHGNEMDVGPPHGANGGNHRMDVGPPHHYHNKNSTPTSYSFGANGGNHLVGWMLIHRMRITQTHIKTRSCFNTAAPIRIIAAGRMNARGHLIIARTLRMNRKQITAITQMILTGRSGPNFCNIKDIALVLWLAKDMHLGYRSNVGAKCRCYNAKYRPLMNEMDVIYPHLETTMQLVRLIHMKRRRKKKDRLPLPHIVLSSKERRSVNEVEEMVRVIMAAIKREDINDLYLII